MDLMVKSTSTYNTSLKDGAEDFIFDQIRVQCPVYIMRINIFINILHEEEKKNLI